MTNAIVLEDEILHSKVINRLMGFLRSRGFREVHPQRWSSILAACEDPETLVTHRIGGQLFPLQQTNQMWLERFMLQYPHEEGFCSVTTSYRDEPHPIAGRHERIFSMVEFETKGGIDTLRMLEEDALEFMGLGPRRKYRQISYSEAAALLGASELKAEHEQALAEKFGPVVFLEEFPEASGPFWNMRRVDGLALKIDVLVNGMEAFGSAERGTDPEEMRYLFHTINGGRYSAKLFELFGRERVTAELEEFLALPFIPRCGGGIGIGRLLRAPQLHAI